MRLHDTHCHVDLFENRPALIDEIERAGIHTIAVTNAPSVFHVTERLTAGRRFIRPALGLHPELIATHAHEINLFERLLPYARYVGEVGLDYTHSTAEERVMQRRVFERILSLACRSGGRVFTVHSRGAAVDVIDMVMEHAPGAVILHWFSGTSKALARANEAGMWFSINTAMIRTDKSREKLRAFRREQILLESDGPFVTTGRAPARPGDGSTVVEALALLWECSADEVGAQLHRNLRDCLTRVPPTPVG